MGIIKYLKHDQIDKQKWDDCIRNSVNSLIYGYSYYLDCMADNWDALVMDEYSSVMPLPWKKKFGIQYIYQPFLVAQAGIFATDIINVNVANFIAAIPQKFKLIEISLNTGNSINNIDRTSTVKSNYVLPLSRNYDDLHNGYKENIRRNVKKAMQSGCTLSKDVNVEELISLAVKQMMMQGMETSENVTRFRNLYSILSKRGEAVCYGVHSPNKKLLSCCCFFISGNRAYYILVGNAPEGKEYGASHALIDGVINEYSGKDMILDFEGSDIPGLAFFYSGFGAEHETYPSIKINRLPWYIRLFKH